jgi:hypothetical protein
VGQPWLRNFSGFEEAKIMSTKMESSLEKECAILQIPEISHDGAGGPGSMTTYDHYIPMMMSDGFKWTYGSTTPDFKRYLRTYSPTELEVLRKGGFCAIQVDKFGVDSAEMNALNQLHAKVIHSGARYLVLGI